MKFHQSLKMAINSTLAVVTFKNPLRKRHTLESCMIAFTTHILIVNFLPILCDRNCYAPLCEVKHNYQIYVTKKNLSWDGGRRQDGRWFWQLSSFGHKGQRNAFESERGDESQMKWSKKCDDDTTMARARRWNLGGVQGSTKRRGLGCVNSLPGSAWL